MNILAKSDIIADKKPDERNLKKCLPLADISSRYSIIMRSVKVSNKSALDSAGSKKERGVSSPELQTDRNQKALIRLQARKDEANEADEKVSLGMRRMPGAACCGLYRLEEPCGSNRRVTDGSKS